MSDRPSRRFRDQITSRAVPGTEDAAAKKRAPEPATRDDAADQAALDALREEGAGTVASPSNGHDPGIVTPPVLAATGTPPPGTPPPIPPPPQPPQPPQPGNIFLHGYRELSPEQMDAIRACKDLALMLFHHLHAIDGSPLEDPFFNSREMAEAGLKLEESLMWVEKFFAI